MGAPTPHCNDEVPAYEELYSQPPSNPSTGVGASIEVPSEQTPSSISIHSSLPNNHNHHHRLTPPQYPPSPIIHDYTNELLYAQYSHIPTTAADTRDLTIDIERTAHKHHPHPQRSTLSPSPNFELDETPTPDPQQPSEGPHFHCAECDRQMDSRERRRLCAKVTNAVTGTLMIISFFVMIGYIFMVMRR
ncbi:hypothetical protein N7539_002575 [Penicillium diatomitis]|uniref:Uncharacterized protein n=1 Tax=Penicillium diatomitis TaxID=2819901 RepID=A0A9X0BZ84_9EURO|nr:uncharacterized protein N7539_002575 [Penicillium diatomitis]KAJ5491008.1 hypothetical protein N7539_002575 [Penicillium diatomitis]